MYAREVQGQLLTFGVSGKLIMNALVMYDHQTDSLWSHFLGEAVKGPLAGTRLEMIPTTQTTWGQWRQLHPDTLVLAKTGGYFGDVYESYYRSRSTGIIGETVKDDRLPAKEVEVGVMIEGVTKAYGFSGLGSQPVFNDTMAGHSLVVAFDASSGTAVVFQRRVDGRVLTFHAEEPGEDGAAGLPVMIDAETHTRWNALSGEALEGKRLGRVPSNYAFWFAWKDYHPDTEVYPSVSAG